MAVAELCKNGSRSVFWPDSRVPIKTVFGGKSRFQQFVFHSTSDQSKKSRKPKSIGRSVLQKKNSGWPRFQLRKNGGGDGGTGVE